MTSPTEDEWAAIRDEWESFHSGTGSRDVDTSDAGVDEAAVPDEPIVEEQEEDIGRGDMGPGGSSGSDDGAEVVMEINETEAQQHQRRTKSVIEELQEIQQITDQAERAAAIRQLDKPLTIDKGVRFHITEEDHDTVHEILAEQIDSTPENFYDHSKESELDGWDRYYYWDLTRDEVDEPWVPNNINLQELIAAVETQTDDGMVIESDVYELA